MAALIENHKANVLLIGSRESELALKQTDIVQKLLVQQQLDIHFKIEQFKTKGDKVLDVALNKIGGKSLFTKELEDALLKNAVTFVVHSLKDLPTTLPEGLTIGAVLEREDPRDCVLFKKGCEAKCLSELPEKSVVGTSSLRRVAQLKRHYPSLKFESIRGNLNTRLHKLDEGNIFSAVILAAAGVKRMGWKSHVSQYLDDNTCMYAVGQGALAVECKEEDEATLAMLSSLIHLPTTLSVIAERAFMFTLEGGCSAPVAVASKIDGECLSLKGGVWSLDGKEELVDVLKVKLSMETEASTLKRSRARNTFCGISSSQHYTVFSEAYQLGVDLANKLLSKGAKGILDNAKTLNAAIV